MMTRRRGRKLTAIVVLCSFLFHISPLPALASVARHREPTPRGAAFHVASNIQSNIQQAVQHRADISVPVPTGELALKEVLEVFVREHDELLHIETERSLIIDATRDHPFYVVGKGWTAAGDLIIGDAFYALSGDVGVVTGLTLEELDAPILVYNLDVADFDTYFVGDGVLVHNAGCNNKRVLEKTKIKGHEISMDLEMGGSQKPNIHILMDGVKYMWDESVGKFLSDSGKQLPRSLRGVRLIEDAFQKAKNLINSGWGNNSGG